MLKLQPPQSEKHYNNLLNIWIFIALFSLLICVASYKNLENFEGVYASIAGFLTILSFFVFICGLIIHNDYDIIPEEDLWQVEKLRKNNQDIANYLLEVGKKNRKLVRVELRNLLEYSTECKKIQQEKRIYGKQIKH